MTDFLSPGQRSGTVIRDFDVSGSVKDMIESCGVPHTEIDLIIANGRSVDFSYQVRDGDQISVYPVFESFDITPIVKVRPEPLRVVRFVTDDHLRRLARFLRLLGLDTLYDQTWSDRDLVQISTRQRRILLTRDVDLLKHGSLTHGYFVRASDPREQVIEVARRFQVKTRPFTRCMVCNGGLRPVRKEEIADRLPPVTRDHIDEYRVCSECEKLYWHGAHYDELSRIVEAVERDAFPGDAPAPNRAVVETVQPAQ